MKRYTTKEKVIRHLKWAIPVVLAITALTVAIIMIDEFARAEQAAEEAFNATPYNSDNDIQGYSIYIPQGFVVNSESENNIELVKGSQQYLVFINDKEGSTSTVTYDALTEREGAELDTTFETEEQFGYIVANEMDDEVVLVVGIGGIKVTTKTDKSSLESDASDMMNIAKSIHPADEEINSLDEEVEEAEETPAEEEVPAEEAPTEEVTPAE